MRPLDQLFAELQPYVMASDTLKVERGEEDSLVDIVRDGNKGLDEFELVTIAEKGPHYEIRYSAMQPTAQQTRMAVDTRVPLIGELFKYPSAQPSQSGDYVQFISSRASGQFDEIRSAAREIAQTLLLKEQDTVN